MQWAPRVPEAERADFERSVQRDGLPDYRICQEDGEGNVVPAGVRNEYFPILFAATRQNFDATFGWDFGAVPVLRESMEKCVETNLFVVSPPVPFSAEGDQQPCLQTFLPVYDSPKNMQTAEDRRQHLKGYLVGLCQLDDLIENALKYAAGPQGVDMAILDESLPQGRQVLYYHSSRTRLHLDEDEAAVGLSDPTSLEVDGIHHTATLTFGARIWTFLCKPVPMFFTPYADWRSWTLLGVGLLLSYVASRYTFMVTTRTARIQRLVDERTHELRQKDEQLRQSQKLEAIGLLAGGIAHEFNNLLQAISGYTRYAMEGIPQGEQSYKDLESVLEASDRAASLTRQLLSFSRRQTVDRRHLDANEMVADLTRMLCPLLGEHVKLKMHLGKNVGAVFADSGSFQQVLVNLCLNARDAMPEGGEIIVKTERMNITAAFSEHYADLKPGHYVEVAVSDTGLGMTPEVCEHIFEPFFTTKPVGQGTGLGLPMVYGIVQQHEGAIHVYSEPGYGSTFKIYLPSTDLGTEAFKGDDSAVEGGRETLLVADDDPQVRDVARRILTKSGYTVMTANDGEAALEAVRKHHGKISLVLLDAVMPKMSGREVYYHVKDEFPGMKVVFCSGYDPETQQSNYIVNEHLQLVEKPYNPECLLRTVRQVLDAEGICSVG